MVNWPSWRFQKELDDAEAKAREHVRIREARDEALQELQASRRQLDQVRELSAQHEPVRDKLKAVRDKNKFAEGFLKIIQEGR